jgi:hypothetical protein
MCIGSLNIWKRNFQARSYAAPCRHDNDVSTGKPLVTYRDTSTARLNLASAGSIVDHTP